MSDAFSPVSAGKIDMTKRQGRPNSSLAYVDVDGYEVIEFPSILNSALCQFIDEEGDDLIEGG